MTTTTKWYNEDNTGILIGNFQPFNCTHLRIIKDAVSHGIKRFKLLLCGATSPRSPRRPFSYKERVCMIHEALKDYTSTRAADLCAPLIPQKDSCVSFMVSIDGVYCHFDCRPIADHLYRNARWTADVLDVLQHPTHKMSENVLLGSDYDKHIKPLHMKFPELKVHMTSDAPNYDIENKEVSGQSIRRLFYSKRFNGSNTNSAYMQLITEGRVVKAVADMMCEYVKTHLLEWHSLRNDYLSSKRIPNTVNLQALVILQKDNEVLVVRTPKRHKKTGEVVRSISNPLWQFPTAMLDPRKPTIDNVMDLATKYLIIDDEPRIKEQSLAMLKANLVGHHLIDHARREDNNYNIVDAFHFIVPDSIDVSLIASDWDSRVSMMPINTLLQYYSRINMKFDHYDIAELFF